MLSPKEKTRGVGAPVSGSHNIKELVSVSRLFALMKILALGICAAESILPGKV